MGGRQSVRLRQLRRDHDAMCLYRDVIRILVEKKLLVTQFHPSVLAVLPTQSRGTWIASFCAESEAQKYSFDAPDRASRERMVKCGEQARLLSTANRNRSFSQPPISMIATTLR